MQELITVESQPAEIAVNYDELKAALEADLKKYDVVVTEDTLADAKKLATELNKQRKAIDDRRKAEVAKASEPVRVFDQQMKDLAGLYEDGRKKILEQVKRFEDEARETARQLLEQKRDEYWVDHEVGPEFRKAEYQDLVNLSALTKKGALTSAVKKSLHDRVKDDRALQDRTERRLLELENASHRAGLAAPLTRDHVAHFLFESDDKYKLELDRILEAEVKRQQAAEERERKRLQDEADRKAREVAQRQAREAQEEAQRQQREQEQAQEGAPATEAPEATEFVRVTATFAVEVPTVCSNQQIENTLRQKMADAGFVSRPEITVERLG